MNKLAKLIQHMDQDELLALKKDFEKGTLHTLLDKRNKELRDDKLVLCPVCSTPIKQGVGYYVEFGKEIRKKATFDGLDCLEYFFSKTNKS